MPDAKVGPGTYQRGCDCHGGGVVRDLRRDAAKRSQRQRARVHFASHSALAGESGGPARYIEAGSRLQNGYAESFRSHFRDECLPMEDFETLAGVRWLTMLWRDYYNQLRPHSSFGCVPWRFSRLGV